MNFKLTKMVMQPMILPAVIGSPRKTVPKIVPKTGINRTTLTAVLGPSSSISWK